jgi:hypothetical protein
LAKKSTDKVINLHRTIALLRQEVDETIGLLRQALDEINRQIQTLEARLGRLAQPKTRRCAARKGVSRPRKT